MRSASPRRCRANGRLAMGFGHAANIGWVRQRANQSSASRMTTRIGEYRSTERLGDGAASAAQGGT